MEIQEAIANLTLKEMDGTLLTAAIIDSVDQRIKDDIIEAVKMAAFFHRGETRANRGVMPRDHYVTHPLRNTLRLLRWGVRDRDVLIAELLHDTVEDCADELVKVLAEMECQEPRYAALDLLGERYGSRVRELLVGVTNPMLTGLSREEKHEAYRQHVLEAVNADPGVLLVKISDFIDNAGSLHHNISTSIEMVRKLASKYKPLVEPLKKSIEEAEIDPRVKAQILEQLVRVGERLENFTS